MVGLEFWILFKFLINLGDGAFFLFLALNPCANPMPLFRVFATLKAFSFPILFLNQ